MRVNFLSLAATLGSLLAVVSAQDVSSLTASDICAEVKAELKVPSLLLGGKLVSVGKLNDCICLSKVNSFVLLNPTTLAGILVAGKDKTVAAVVALVKANGQNCNYPPHAVPECKKGKPCYFDCKDGYTESPADKPTQCVCKKPYIECNGKCGPYKACPSGHPKRELESRSLHCPHGLTACRVPGRGARVWECLDTLSDLESCGGCPSPFETSSLDGGRDCAAIDGVSDVSCVAGSCVVHRCRPGFRINRAGNSCIYHEEEDPILIAAEYGLEHGVFRNNGN